MGGDGEHPVQLTSGGLDFLSIDSEKCLRCQVPNNNYIRMMIKHLTCDKCTDVPYLPDSPDRSDLARGASG